MRSSAPPRSISAPPSSRTGLRSGEHLTDRYTIQKQLAAGGMGVVYQVLDRSTGEARALKRMMAEANDQHATIEAFEREYQVLAGLSHPRIIRVFDYGVDAEGPYYTMELVEGQDMRNAAPIPYREACVYLRDVATSLSLLHARRLLHRDVSPGNVRMTPDGHCKLLDFGALAPFGNSRLVVGTPPTIAPEAVEGAALDQRTDLYALGALAYWMLTRQHAFPATRIGELAEVWKRSPPSPSAIVEDIPVDLDALVLSLLSADPLARPASAAEVISHLNVIADLPAENEGEAERLAQSFLLNPRFIGRAEALRDMQSRIDHAVQGQGSAVRVEAIAGMGRTRFLEEIGVRAQLAGATVLRVDASMHQKMHGTARALAMRLLDLVPHLARERSPRHLSLLTQLGRDIAPRLSAGPGPPASLPPASFPPPSSRPPGIAGAEMSTLEGWFADVSRAKPLVIGVDNVEYADDASLGLLAALARIAKDHPLFLVVTEATRLATGSAIGLSTLRSHCARIPLSGLDPKETLELVRSLFGDAPNVERFADWLYGRTAGSPLHCVEISRQLVSRQTIRHFGGMWMLPMDRPDAELPAALEDALRIRISSLGGKARALAECLSLERTQPTIALCRLLFEDEEDRVVNGLLDELLRNDVLSQDEDGYRFSSAALADALLAGMDDARREGNHKRLGEALSRSAGDDCALQIEAGWHLIKGGEGVRGAETIAAVTADSVTVRVLIANLHHAGEPIEAALHVYKRARRSTYERMPLLAALAYAGYYENRIWGERYGDEALDALEDISGLRTARKLRRFLGRFLGLALGVLFSFVRFYFTPKRERNYSFAEMLVQLFGAVTTLTGAAALSLDGERAGRVADVLEPFSVLPERLTPVGIYQFCRALEEMGRDRPATACATFEELLKRFQDPRYYPTLPEEARQLYLTGAHFARGSFAVFREDGRGVLESADALDASGIKLYAMIASQLRFLYYLRRGEQRKAMAHRDLVELHAAHVGSAWQVEFWEAPSLIPLFVEVSDVIALTRIANRLEALSRTVPSLKKYHRLSRSALSLVRRDDIESASAIVGAETIAVPPRGYIGWTASLAYEARGRNELGQYAVAKAACDRALVDLTDEDREYTGLFLSVEIQAAVADAGLGQVDEGLARIDALLERFRGSDHPLVPGLLHEARARIAWAAGRRDEYQASVAEVERRFRPTEMPALIAMCERLAKLGGAQGGQRHPPGSPDAYAVSAMTDAETTLRKTEGTEDNIREIDTVRALSKRQKTA